MSGSSIGVSIRSRCRASTAPSGPALARRSRGASSNETRSTRRGQGERRSARSSRSTIGEARSIMTAAAGRRNAVRWEVALGLGLRQGEVLGLQWDDVDFVAGTLRVRRALQQGKWRHGCTSEGDCGLSPQCCPQRFGGGLIVGPPKSRKGTRTLVLTGAAGLSSQRPQVGAGRGTAGGGNSVAPGAGEERAPLGQRVDLGQPRSASRSILAGIGRSGSECWPKLVSAMPACRTPGTRPPPSCWLPAWTPERSWTSSPATLKRTSRKEESDESSAVG